jgi:NADH-quinone oxidoreductase subunit L
MNKELLPWLILFAPLVATAIITVFTRTNRRLSAGISIAAVVFGCVLSLVFAGWAGWHPAPFESTATWLEVGDLKIQFGLRFDALSILMMVIVTGVASLIHIYSWGYMSEDRGFSRFFACLSLFTFSMLGIVLSNNFLQLFIFWELVGVCSYLLIGFWFERPAAADAGKKAFITNRLGDFGFFIGILWVWAAAKSLNFGDVQHAIELDNTILGSATIAGLLIFCGAMGKSAQFPLHVWLPDAMEGPTPVSALIHAATMVAAGVYMLCRVFFLFTIPGSHALEVIAWIGGFTALLAALIAVQQNDIKRILAYSTLSQLGYMIMAVGLGGPAQAMFHLTTHAFFKALLFLAAGSIIHVMHHEQDIWRMSDLRRRMPVTFWTFMAGTLALAGVPPLSGFYSKDGILAQALHTNLPLFVLGTIVAILTTFYMFRLVFVVFGPPARLEDVSNVHESPPVMLWPLRFLAVLSIIGGFIGLGVAYNHFFSGKTESGATMTAQLLDVFENPVALLAGLVAIVLGYLAASALYQRAAIDPLPARLGAFARWMRNRFYLDEIYEATFIRFHEFLSRIADAIDRVLIDGVGVGLVRGGTELAGKTLRQFQTGNLQAYAVLFALGVAIVLYLALK